MDHIFTFPSYLYVFNFRPFLNISKTVFGYSHSYFCREFQALSFNSKKGFNHKLNRRKIFQILMSPFFLGHPLVNLLVQCSNIEQTFTHKTSTNKTQPPLNIQMQEMTMLLLRKNILLIVYLFQSQ